MGIRTILTVLAILAWVTLPAHAETSQALQDPAPPASETPPAAEEPTVSEASAGDPETAETDSEEGNAALELEAILAEIAESDDYAESSNCLRMRAYRSVEILDDRHLLFIGKRKMWVNELRNRCASLRPDQILMFERRGSKICETDRVSGRDRHHMPGNFYGSCLLGRFAEIDEQQALALRDAISQARETKHRKEKSES